MKYVRYFLRVQSGLIGVKFIVHADELFTLLMPINFSS